MTDYDLSIHGVRDSNGNYYPNGWRMAEKNSLKIELNKLDFYQNEPLEYNRLLERYNLLKSLDEKEGQIDWGERKLINLNER